VAVRRSAKKPQKKESGLGFIIGLAVLLFLVGVLLFNRDRIARIAEAARSAEGTAKPVAAVPPEQPPAAAPAPAAQPAAPQQQPDKTSPEPSAAPAKPAPETTPPPAKPAEQKPVSVPPAATPQKPAPQAPAPAKPAPTPTAAPPAKKPPEKPAVQARERTLWFVKVGDDGVIERVKEIRSLPVSDSPLADSIGALMAGPSEAARKKGYSSLIPQGTKLLSATVRGATAYLSFSDQFQFNSYGIEGFAAQLRQIVWTATEFDTVKDVQILIEGRRVDYLGLEGIWIGSPIGRSTL
jgi:spore germination protein GerM